MIFKPLIKFRVFITKLLPRVDNRLCCIGNLDKIIDPFDCLHFSSIAPASLPLGVIPSNRVNAGHKAPGDG